MNAAIGAIAHAKVTLSLQIVGVRDDGYHELDALVVSASAPSDVVHVEFAAETRVTMSGACAVGVPIDESNLAVRAARALGVHAAIAIRKEIPAGAGLGGGSADAAAVLLALRALHDLALSDDDLARIGAHLGADVPACLRGGALRMQGIGDELHDVTVPPIGLVIATPPFGCPTSAVYAAWDRLGGPRSPGADPGIAGLPPLANDLEPAAIAVEPRLAPFRDRVAAAAGAPALLAGSGSSYFVVCATPAHADERARAVATALDETARVSAAAVAPVGVTLGP